MYNFIRGNYGLYWRDSYSQCTLRHAVANLMEDGATLPILFRIVFIISLVHLFNKVYKSLLFRKGMSQGIYIFKTSDFLLKSVVFGPNLLTGVFFY